MENLKHAIGMLSAVVSTMDTISVTGIDNQDKFVGCVVHIRSAAKMITDYIAEESAPKEDVSNG